MCEECVCDSCLYIYLTREHIYYTGLVEPRSVLKARPYLSDLTTCHCSTKVTWWVFASDPRQSDSSIYVTPFCGCICSKRVTEINKHMGTYLPQNPERFAWHSIPILLRFSHQISSLETNIPFSALHIQVITHHTRKFNQSEDTRSLSLLDWPHSC